MGLGNRTARSHSTVAASKAAGRAEVYHDFQPGQKVMTSDGFPGVVASVEDGFAPGAETYQVVLDKGMGGGEYRVSQLSALHEAKPTLASTDHLASDDYPELAEILIERPDIAVNQYMGSKKTASWIRNEDHGWDEAGEHDPVACRECGSFEHDEDDHDEAMARGHYAAFDPYAMVVEASSDSDFRFHVTASWSDVRNKAKRIRSEGGVRIVSARDDSISAEVKGEHHTYETRVVYVPGAHKRVASWDCGCKWASYSWGRTGYWRKFEGRMCSHALALSYEAQSRGMFGREIKEDTGLYFQKAHSPIVTEYDKVKDRNLTRRTVPPGNMKTVFTSAREMDTVSPVSILIAQAHLDGEDPFTVQSMLRTASIQVEGFWPLLLRALPMLTEMGEGAAAGEAAGAGAKALDVAKTVAPYAPYVRGGGGQKSGPEAPDAADTDPDGPKGPDTPSAHTDAVPSFQDGRSLNFENDAAKQAAVNNPWGEPAPAPDLNPTSPGATRPHDPSANPGSTGFAVSPDPDSWSQPMGLHNETSGMESYGSLYDEGDDGETDLCANCGNTIRRTTIDPSIPWVHHHSGNSKCDVSSPADAVTLQGVDTPIAHPTVHEYDHSIFEALLHDSPEPALPTTDGDLEDPEDPLSEGANSNTTVRPNISNDSMTFGGPGIMSTGSVENIVAQFQQKAAHLNPGSGAAQDSNDIAEAARAFLSKEAVRDFSPLERQELIGEGKDVRARNLDRLDIQGTHYALMDDDIDDETWLG